MPSKNFLLIIGFSVLAIAFFLSLPSSVDVFYGEDYHVIIYLEANSSSLFSMLQNVVLLGFIPIVASLILHVTAYLKGNYAEIASLKRILIFLAGGLSATWGYMYCAASYITYYDAISLARDWHVVGIEDYLLQIYSAYGLVGAVWLILGIFLKAVSVYRARMGKIHSDVMQKGFKALNSCLNKK